MCIAGPMQVVSRRSEDGIEPQVAVVESAGIRKEIRLEMVDRIPELGEYVIIHAGFAIRSLTVAEAECNLALMRQMAESLEKQGRLPGVMEE